MIVNQRTGLRRGLPADVAVADPAVGPPVVGGREGPGAEGLAVERAHPSLPRRAAAAGGGQDERLNPALGEERAEGEEAPARLGLLRVDVVVRRSECSADASRAARGIAGLRWPPGSR